MKHRYSCLALSVKSLLVAGAVFGAALPAWAADSEGDNAERIEVLGSRIKRVNIEGASPIVAIDRETIAKQGFANVTEALNSLTQNAGGQLSQQNTFGFTPSANAIDLRGFGVGRSLVLIDGRRVPQFPLAAGGTDNFVDLSSIPAAAIERVEVLTDGASAIYGSDAISGVVNIILRKDIEDSTLSLRRGLTAEGGGAQKRLQFVTGVQSEKTSASFFLEWFDRDTLDMVDRERSESDVHTPGEVGSLSSFGNTFVGSGGRRLASTNCDPALGFRVNGQFCGYDRSTKRQIEAPLERKSMQTVVTHEINDHLESFLRAGYVNSVVDTQIEANPYTSPTVARGAANNPTNGLPAAQQFAGAFQRRTIEWGPRTSHTDTDSINVVGGLKGTFAESYDWEAGINYGEQKLTSTRGGFQRKDAIDKLVRDGTLNLFDTVDAATVAATAAQPRTDGEAKLLGVDFQLSGELFEMSAGPAMFSVIAEGNRQEFSDQRDIDQLTGNIVGLGGTAGAGEREYAALGGELLFPLLDNLNLNLAGRYDKYFDDSNVDGAFSPKVSVEYRPLKNLLIRASAGESFRAPDMQRLFGAQTRAFTSVVDTPECLRQGGSGRGDASVDACVTPLQSVPATSGSNLDLEEETGKSYNLGTVWQATDELSVGVDLWSLKVDGLVNTPDAQDILDNPSNYPAGTIQRLPANVSSANPTGLTLSSVAQNLSFQKMEGVDLKFEYGLATDGIGNFNFKLNTSYIATYETQANDSAPVVNELKDAEGRLNAAPEWKGNASANWNLNEWSASAYLNYVGDYVPSNVTVQKEIGSYTTLNLSGAYELPWDAKIQAGVNNVLDREPPLVYTGGRATQSPFYSQAYHDILGRTYYAEYTQRF